MAGVGVVFQACLLLVLIVWKPTSDDAALFYVISAAWGVCNAIWDTLTFCKYTKLWKSRANLYYVRVRFPAKVFSRPDAIDVSAYSRPYVNHFTATRRLRRPMES